MIQECLPQCFRRNLGHRNHLPQRKGNIGGEGGCDGPFSDLQLQVLRFEVPLKYDAGLALAVTVLPHGHFEPLHFRHHFLHWGERERERERGGGGTLNKEDKGLNPLLPLENQWMLHSAQWAEPVCDLPPDHL